MSSRQVNCLKANYGRITNVLWAEAHIGIPFAPTDPVRPNLIKYRAIWDTGATGSVITKTVVDALGLKPISAVETHGVHGKQMANVHLVSLGLPSGCGFCELRVTEGLLAGFDVLIGMDVIAQGDFVVTNHNGRTEMLFNMPSEGLTRLLQTSNEMDRKIRAQGGSAPPAAQPFHAPPKIGRNDPCPCKSGKKFKHCCGR